MSLMKVYRQLAGPMMPRTRRTVITATQYKAMFTTPIVIVPAPKTGYVNILQWLLIHKQTGTAYVGANNITVNYKTDASGLELAEIAVSGFADATTVQTRFAPNTAAAAGAASSIVPLAAEPIVITVGTANPTTGTGSFIVLATYLNLPMVP